MDLDDAVRVGLDTLVGDFSDPVGDPIALATLARLSKDSELLLREGSEILASYRELLGAGRPALDRLTAELQSELAYLAEEEARTWLQAAQLESRYSSQLVLDIHGRAHHFRGKQERKAACEAVILDAECWLSPRGYLTSWRLRGCGQQGDRRLLRPAIHWSVATEVCSLCQALSKEPAEVEAFAVFNDDERRATRELLPAFLDRSLTVEAISFQAAKTVMKRRLACEGEQAFTGWIDELELDQLFNDCYPNGYRAPDAHDFELAIDAVPAGIFVEERGWLAIVDAERRQFDRLIVDHLLPALLPRLYPEVCQRLAAATTGSRLERLQKILDEKPA